MVILHVVNRAFSSDVMASMLVHQNERILRYTNVAANLFVFFTELMRLTSELSNFASELANLVQKTRLVVRTTKA